jgi:hypothetical protein
VSERGLASYLLLPRPGDLIKAWIFPAAFALGVLAAGGASGREVLRAAVIWFALELLIYQARYQWNDIRGFEADQRHPDRAGRGRLPGPPSRGEQHIRASALGAAARLGLTALAGLALAPLELGWPLLGLTLAVFAVAALYEVLRSRATGRSDRVPPPLTFDIAALWIVVGGGYAIRGFSGLALGTDLFGAPGLPLAAALAFWAFGIAFVTSRWALEALAFARRDSQGRLAWQVEAGQAREHTLALARWLPAPGAAATAGSSEGSLSDWRPLVGHVSPLAPWNLAAILSAAAAAAAGRLLAGGTDPLGVALAVVAGGTLAALVLASRGRRWIGWICGSAALAALLAAASSPRPALAALPWLCLVGAHLFFTAQSLRTLPHPLRSAVGEARSRLLSSRGEGLSIAPVRR